MDKIEDFLLLIYTSAGGYYPDQRVEMVTGLTHDEAMLRLKHEARDNADLTKAFLSLPVYMPMKTQSYASAKEPGRSTWSPMNTKLT